MEQGRGKNKYLRTERLSDEAMRECLEGKVIDWRFFRKLEEDQARKILERYVELYNRDGTAYQFGVSTESVRKIMIDLGMIPSGHRRWKKGEERKGVYVSPKQLDKYKNGEHMLSWRKLERMGSRDAKEMMDFYISKYGIPEMEMLWKVSEEEINKKWDLVNKLEEARKAKKEGYEEMERYFTENRVSDLGEVDVVMSVREWKENEGVREYLNKIGEIAEMVGEDVHVDMVISKAKKEG